MKIETILGLLFYFWSACFMYAQLEIEEITGLPNTINETSGLLYFNDVLITHNDSGNGAELFEFDSQTGEIVRTVEVTNATNIDWEDLAQDDDFIYIGDFGNINGNRRNLVIYKIDKQQYLSQNQVTASLISFVYEDQLEFNSTQNSDWDAEALFVKGDFLYILTKEWQSSGTTLYQLSKTTGNSTATKVDEYDINGLATGAVYNGDLNQLIIVGYSQFLVPFIVTIDEVPNAPPFLVGPTKEELEVFPLQIESVAADSRGYFFTSEEFVNSAFGITSSARLFFLKR
nr:hypothetical protein [Allomuricauda sp.]